MFAYRASASRAGTRRRWPGFEQNDYVKNGGFGERRLTDLAEEFAAVRGASIALFRSLSQAAWARRGTASG